MLNFTRIYRLFAYNLHGKILEENEPARTQVIMPLIIKTIRRQPISHFQNE
jgi:hypothetical protein